MGFKCCHSEHKIDPVIKGMSRRDLVDWNKAERQRDEQEAPIRRAALRIFSAIAEPIPLNVIADAIRSGQPEGIIERIVEPELPPIDDENIPERMRKAATPITATGVAITTAATRAQEKEIAAALQIRTALMTLAWASGESTMASLGGSFTLVNPYTVPFLENRTAELVTEITATTREAIRETVAQLYLEGGSPQRLARRVKPLIGLRSDQMRAVMRRAEQLTIAGVSKPAQDRALAAYGRKLLRQRATLIARTETIFAQAAGQDQAFRFAVDQGLVLAGSVRVWVADPGERTCPICLDLDGQEQPIGGIFESIDGPVQMPPAHPNCRCAIVLETR
jgi:hypothetical protein